MLNAIGPLIIFKENPLLRPRRPSVANRCDKTCLRTSKKIPKEEMRKIKPMLYWKLIDVNYILPFHKIQEEITTELNIVLLMYEVQQSRK